MEYFTKNDLDKTTKNPQDNSRFDLKYHPQSDLLANTLSKMFPEQEHENKTVQRTKQILGDKYTTVEVKSMIASFEYLINTWMEEYEKKVFDGKTLRELLQGL